MIEISVRLLHGAVFFVGEELECWITLRNIDATTNKTEQALGDAKSLVKVAQLNGNHTTESSGITFLTGQIHCQCSVEESKIIIIPKPESKDGTEMAGRRASTASHDQNSFCVVSSVPKCLVENISLSPGEDFTVVYTETIPNSSSPSFRGATLKYSWKLAFGCQVLGQPTTVIHIPLWIMVIQNIESHLAFHEDVKLHDIVERTIVPEEFANGDGPRPDNATVQNGHSSTPSTLTNEIAMQILDNLTSRRTPKIYSIDSPQGKLGKLTLSKTKIRLGEEIHGKFDFSDRSITCVEYLVSLVGEECIHEPFRRVKNLAKTETIVSKVHDFCLCLQQSSFVLPVPLHVTSTFSSEIMDFQWKLRFEFALSPEMLQLEVPSVNNEQQSVLWRPPLVVPVETFTWDVSVEVFPSDPVQIHGVHLRDSLGSDVKVKV